MKINVTNEIRDRISGILRGTLGVSFGLLCLGSAAQMSGSYTINKNAAASSTNYKTFTSAIEDLSGTTRSDGGPSSGGGVASAVTFNVVAGSGPYNEQLNITEIGGASATRTITFNGNGERIQFDGNESDPHVILLDGADHIRLVNLHIKALNNQYGWGIRVANEANQNEIRGCDIDIVEPITRLAPDDEESSCGVCFKNPSGSGITGIENRITGNRIHGNTNALGMFAGIWILTDNTPPGIYSAIIDSNEIYDFRFYGIVAFPEVQCIIRNNDLHNIGMSANATNWFIGIMGVSGIIDGNSIHDPFPNGGGGPFTGIFNTQTMPIDNPVKIRNNRIYNFNSGTNSATAIYIYGSADIENNTIDMSGASVAELPVAIYYFKISQSYPAIIHIRNNAISLTSPVLRAALSFKDKSASDVIVSDNNDLYVGSDSLGYIYGDENVGYRTLESFQLGTGLDLNSMSVDPQFADAAAGDLRPQSPDLDGTGMATGLDHDCNNQPRSLTAPDIGAYEYNIAVNVTSLDIPATACQLDTVSAEVTITNNSALTLSNFTVKFSVNNQIIASGIYPGVIAPGAINSHVFRVPIPGNITGPLTVTSFVPGKTPSPGQTITIKAIPVQVGNIDIVSAGSNDRTMNFAAKSSLPGSSYTWAFGDGGNASGTSGSNGDIAATHLYSADGTYDVILQLGKDGCQSESKTSTTIMITGLDEVSAGIFRVYPNPSAGSFMLEMNGANSAEGLEVLNVQGKVVYTAPSSSLSGNMNVDLNGVAPGIYQVRVQSAGILHSFKIVIQ